MDDMSAEKSPEYCLRIHGLILRKRKKNTLAHCDFSLVHKFLSLHYSCSRPKVFKAEQAEQPAMRTCVNFKKSSGEKNSDWHFSVALIYVTPYRAKHFITPNKTSRDNFPRKLGWTHLKKTQGSILNLWSMGLFHLHLLSKLYCLVTARFFSSQSQAPKRKKLIVNSPPTCHGLFSPLIYLLFVLYFCTK